MYMCIEYILELEPIVLHIVSQLVEQCEIFSKCNVHVVWNVCVHGVRNAYSVSYKVSAWVFGEI